MNTSNNQSYLTKRLLISISKKAVAKASRQAKAIAGSIVKVEGNHVVRHYNDGTSVIIAELDANISIQQLKLD